MGTKNVSKDSELFLSMDKTFFMCKMGKIKHQSISTLIGSSDDEKFWGLEEHKELI